MLESKWRTGLVGRIEKRFPGCFVIRLDPAFCQGIPDLLVLFETTWAALETKRETKSKRQPNQPYYIELLNRMCFAAFIHPENEEEILDELERAFRDR